MVWLPKTDLANAITSLQAAKTWACLVRAGKRFGLRTFAQDAQQVHDQYKPQTPFLESGAISHYLVGPLPFGATKATLGRVFAKWGWVARPVQPRGRSSDGGGILWEVHASQQPECEAYSMDHGDVIISDLTKRKPQEKLHTDIVASARTIAALHASQPTVNIVNRVPNQAVTSSLTQIHGQDMYQQPRSQKLQPRQIPVRHTHARLKQFQPMWIVKLLQPLPRLKRRCHPVPLMQPCPKMSQIVCSR